MTEAERLAAALAFVLFDGHPSYGSTAGWRGGIGGAAITQGCSLIDPSPADEWMGLGWGFIVEPLRDFLRDHPDFDLNTAKAALRDELSGEFAAAMMKPGPS